MANLAIASTFSLKRETWGGPPSKMCPPPRVMLYAADRANNKCGDASSKGNQAIATFYLEIDNASRLPNKCRHFFPSCQTFPMLVDIVSVPNAKRPRLQTAPRPTPELNACGFNFEKEALRIFQMEVLT